jgi:leucyl aminopeptidase
MFCNDERLAGDLMRHAEAQGDPLWRLPLWQPYANRLDSKVADLNNVADGPHAGAITAALFLERFVGKATPWIHLDLFAWNDKPRPGRPEGGEAMAIRALYALIAERFGGRRARRVRA